MKYCADVFISYSREDRELMRELTKHLNGLVHSGHIRPWTDQCLDPGDLWEPEIQRRLESADIIILLISASYWSSTYAAKKELTIAVERGKSRSATVVPIIAKPCSWKNSVIAEFNILPANGEPLSRSPDLDTVLAEIADQICNLSIEISKSQSSLVYEGGAALAAPVLEKMPTIRLEHIFSHPDRVLDAAFNRTTSKVATVCFDGRVRVFSIANGYFEEASIQAKPGSLNSVSWSKSGREIATGDSDGMVRIWRDGAETRNLLVCDKNVWNAEYDFEGSRMVVGSEDGSVSVWDPRAAKLIWKEMIHRESVNSVRFSSDGQNIVTSSTDGSSVVLASATGREKCRFLKHFDKVNVALFVSSDFGEETQCVSAGSDGRLFMWRIADPDQYNELTTHRLWIHALTCSPEGGFVVSGGYDAYLKFIDLSTGSIYESIAVELGPIYCVRMSLDGTLLLVGAQDGNTYLYSVTR